MLIAALSAMYPSSATGCTGVCISMLVVSLLHVIYLALVSRVEQRLAVANGAILVGTCALTLAVLLAHDVTGTSLWSELLGWGLLLTNVFFFVQLVILSVVAVLEHIATTNDGEGDKDAALLTVPLALPAALALSGDRPSPVADPITTNPLLQDRSAVRVHPSSRDDVRAHGCVKRRTDFFFTLPRHQPFHPPNHKP